MKELSRVFLLIQLNSEGTCKIIFNVVLFVNCVLHYLYGVYSISYLELFVVLSLRISLKKSSYLFCGTLTMFVNLLRLSIGH